MEEVGDFDNENPDLDYGLDHDDDDDEQEVNTTRPFQPGYASTPYFRGEQIEMQTMQHEPSRLPETSHEETPLLGSQSESQKSWTALTNLFPEASATNLDTSYRGGRLQVKMSGSGKKLYYLSTQERGTGKQRLNPSLPKENRDSLGPMAQERIDQENESIRQDRQNLREAEKQLK